MRYLSVCSGIEAATVAWHPLGWTPAAFSEIEAFPRAVLAHRWPSVPIHGDFTTIKGDEYGPIDLLVGGTPCQSFSVAGLRGGLADDRGNLALEFLRLADRSRPKWLVWENVPGVLSSNGGRDFGSILGGLVELGYGFAYRVLDAQFFGVPQRRRRVFVVGCLGDWRGAAAVLFERHSLSGNPPPSRKTGQGVAPTIASRPSGGGGLWTDFDCDGGLIARAVKAGDQGHRHDPSTDNYVTVARCVTARQQRLDWETENFIPILEVGKGTTSRGDGPNGSGIGRSGDPMFTLQANAQHAIAFSSKDHGADASNIAPTLRAGGHSKSHANAGVPPAIAFQSSQSGVREVEAHATLDSNNGSRRHNGVALGASVRRLTPRECERLQGFPDDYTLIPYRGKEAADGPRYKALGNSMAVPVMNWIGRRIQSIHGRAILEAAA